MLVFKRIPEELDQFQSELVIAVVGEDERPLRSTNAWLDWRLYGTITELMDRALFTGKLGERCLLPTYGKFSFDRVVLLGGGVLFDPSLFPTEESGQIRWNTIADQIHEIILQLKVEKVGLSLPRFDFMEQERALLKSLQQSQLSASTSLFLSRLPTTLSPQFA